jgi:hypothetical protein
MSIRWGSFSSVFLRYALGLGFLSAMADRLGLWGAFGQPNVEWGISHGSWNTRTAERLVKSRRKVLVIFRQKFMVKLYAAAV